MPAPPYRPPAGLDVARRFAAAEARFDPTAGAPPRPRPRRHDAAPSRREVSRIVLKKPVAEIVKEGSRPTYALRGRLASRGGIGSRRAYQMTATGYSAYGSLGRFTLQATVPAATEPGEPSAPTGVN